MLVITGTTFAMLLILTITTAHTVEDMNNLIQDKTKNYNKKFRPVFDQSETLYVGAHFELISLKEFDEVNGKLAVVGFLIFGWTDQLLAWKPEDYGNMTEFAAEGGDFWKPNLVLVNAHDKLEAVGNDWNVVRYQSSGVVTVSPGAVFETACSIDVTHYPWDEQECSLVFTPWGYSVKEVHIVAISEDVGTIFYGGHGAWDLVQTQSVGYSDTLGSSLIQFSMRLRRKPLFTLVNVILPIVIMSFLSMVVFLIPTESGERMSYCLTVLLAIAVFLTLVGDNLPRTSDPISVLSYYLLTVLILSVCIVFATVFSLKLYFHDEDKPVPKCVTAFVRCIGCKCKREIDFSSSYQSRQKRRSRYRPYDDSSYRHHNGRYSVNNVGQPVTPDYPGRWNHDNDVERYTSVSSKNHHSEGTSKKRSNMTASDKGDDATVTWKDVSYIVDIIFFFLFLCALVIATVVFFAMAMNKDNSDEDD